METIDLKLETIDLKLETLALTPQMVPFHLRGRELLANGVSLRSALRRNGGKIVVATNLARKFGFQPGHARSMVGFAVG